MRLDGWLAGARNEGGAVDPQAVDHMVKAYAEAIDAWAEGLGFRFCDDLERLDTALKMLTFAAAGRAVGWDSETFDDDEREAWLALR